MIHLKQDIVVLATATLLTACSSESYPGLELDQTHTGEASNRESQKTEDLGIQVRVFASNPSLAPLQNSAQWETPADEQTTRGSGPFVVPARENTPEDQLRRQRDLNRYKNSIFHIFAFRDYPDDQGPLTYAPDLSKRSTDNAHTDCLIDGYNLLEGLPAKLKENHMGEFHFLKSDLKRDTIPTYSDRFTDIGYNFFGVYLDDWRPTSDNSVRTQDRISYRIPIDGTRDIMAGMAPPLTSELLDQKLERDGIDLTPDQRNKVLNIGNYSSYASYLGIDPEIHFRHMLTTFQFYAYPADESADDVIITGIDVVARKEATFTVAGRTADDLDVSFSDEKETMFLMDYDHSKTDPDDPQLGLYPYTLSDLGLGGRVYYSPEHDIDYYQADLSRCTHVGGDIMLAPDSVYNLVIHYSQIVSHQQETDADGNVVNHIYELRQVDYPASITVPKVRKFRNLETGKIDSIRINYNERKHEYQYLAGYAYPIRIAVYGLGGLKIDVGMDGWTDDEHFDIDFEESDPLSARRRRR